MHSAFVGIPSGRERGRFVTLDLGGTNVRATVLDLPGDGLIRTLKTDSFRLPSTEGSAGDLFRPIARFLGRLLDDGEEYTLGFIFAFPMEQTGVRSGRLTKWTKEFAYTGVEGEDVVQLLEDAIRRESDAFPSLRGLSVGALANDTVGVLAAGALLDPRCDMGLIVATGMNLAVAISNESLVNMECGNFDGVRAIQTAYDVRLDDESDTEGQLMEKMVSGRYLGEIVRLQIDDRSNRRDAFIGWQDGNSAFRLPYAFTTEHMSDVAHDNPDNLTATTMLLRSIGISEPAVNDVRRLREMCIETAQRSARLIAMAIVATATYIDPNMEREHVVATDGSLFRGFPNYRTEVESGIRQLLGPRSERVQVAYVRDGSGLGAGVLAAVTG